MSETVPVYRAARSPLPHGVLELRGQRVALDSDVAALYGVTAQELNKAVTENLRRFPFDHVFVLTPKECEALAALCPARALAGRDAFPRVFTARGLLAIAYLLPTSIAVTASIEYTRSALRFRNAFHSGADVYALSFGMRAYGALDPDLVPLFSALDALSSTPEACA